MKEPKKRERFGSWKPPEWKRVRDFLISMALQSDDRISFFLNDRFEFTKNRVFATLKVSENECGRAFSYLKRLGLIFGPYDFVLKIGEVISPVGPYNTYGFSDCFELTENGWKKVETSYLHRRTKRSHKDLGEEFRKWDGKVYRLETDSDAYKELVKVEIKAKKICFKCNREFENLKDHSKKECDMNCVQDIIG